MNEIEKWFDFFEHLKNVDDPWSQFLYARAKAMDYMRKEMKYSDEQIAYCMSMDEMQVRLILMHWDNSVNPPSGLKTFDGPKGPMGFYKFVFKDPKNENLNEI